MSIVALIESEASANNHWRMPAETRSSSRKATVTDEHKEEAKLLKALWTAYRTKPDSLTQEAFGGKHGIGSQGAVNQFLKGETPLSMKAAKGFAKGLGVNVAAFSPRLAAEAVEMAGVAPRAVPSLLELSEMEAQLVLMFRRLTDDQKHAVVVKANKLYSVTHPGKSAANPYPAKIKENQT